MLTVEFVSVEMRHDRYSIGHTQDTMCVHLELLLKYRLPKSRKKFRIADVIQWPWDIYGVCLTQSLTHNWNSLCLKRMLTKLRITMKLTRWPEIPSWKTSRGHECHNICVTGLSASHEIKNGSTKLLLARQMLSSLLPDSQQSSLLECGFKIVRKRRNTVQDVKSLSPSSKTPRRRRSSGFARPDNPASLPRRPSDDLSEQDYVLQVWFQPFVSNFLISILARRTISSHSLAMSNRISNWAWDQFWALAHSCLVMSVDHRQLKIHDNALKWRALSRSEQSTEITATKRINLCISF